MMKKGNDNSSTALLAQFREAFYLLLSRTFSRELDQEMLKGAEQVSRGLLEAWELMEIPSNPDVETGKTLLETFFSEFREKEGDGVIEELAREYAALFLGVGPKTVSLCESVYRSKFGLLYQSTLFDVQQSYREIGMAKSDQYREPDDHIAVELSYMARLCNMTREAVSAGRAGRAQALQYLSLQRAFLEGHLLQWVPRFSQDLIAAASPGFYRAIAHLLKGYIGIDGRLIDSMIQELNDTPRSKRSKKKVSSDRPATHH